MVAHVGTEAHQETGVGQEPKIGHKGREARDTHQLLEGRATLGTWNRAQPTSKCSVNISYNYTVVTVIAFSPALPK